MDYLHGAKVRRQVRSELTDSGVPPATLEDFDAQKAVPDLPVRGPYRHPALMGELSGAVRRRRIDGRFDSGGERRVFVALTATCQRGVCVRIETPCSKSRPMNPQSSRELSWASTTTSA